MEITNKTCSIYYSKFLSLPFFGNLLYLIQIQNSLLIKMGSSFFLSNKSSKYRKVLISTISRQYSTAICKSPHFGQELRLFKSRLVFDLNKNINFKSVDSKNLYDLMWSLVFCDYVTAKTKKMLRPFIPENFPVYSPTNQSAQPLIQ